VNFAFWYLAVGGLLIAIALAGTRVRRLPMSTSLIYLALGVVIGAEGFGLVRLDPVAGAPVVHRLAEAAVIVSLFTAGLKLRLPPSDVRWWLPMRLASISMVITVVLVAAMGVILLGLPLGAAVLLGAILAPTDPVLASDVQVEDPDDHDLLRFGLTGEAGLNDGAAFPFALLGLGLLGLHDLGAFGWRWLVVDVGWAVVGGLAIGTACGTVVARVVLFLRREHREALGFDDFVALGLIGVSYGVALLAHTYGFLAVFAAGVALRGIEAEASDGRPAREVEAVADGAADEEVAVDPTQAPAYMARAVLDFNEHVERIGEVAIVLVVGGMLAAWMVTPGGLALMAALLLVVRPVSVAIGLAGSIATRHQGGYMAWFGIRGIGSIYYLAWAIEQGIDPSLAERLAGVTLVIVATSIVVHGVSVTPLMSRYTGRLNRIGPARIE
jgi:NhaP-type Na+/H+ or K+/H+ antiporter